MTSPLLVDLTHTHVHIMSHTYTHRKYISINCVVLLCPQCSLIWLIHTSPQCRTLTHIKSTCWSTVRSYHVRTVGGFDSYTRPHNVTHLHTSKVHAGQLWGLIMSPLLVDLTHTHVPAMSQHFRPVVCAGHDCIVLFIHCLCVCVDVYSDDRQLQFSTERQQRRRYLRYDRIIQQHSCITHHDKTHVR